MTNPHVIRISPPQYPEYSNPELYSLGPLEQNKSSGGSSAWLRVRDPVTGSFNKTLEIAPGEEMNFPYGLGCNPSNPERVTASTTASQELAGLLRVIDQAILRILCDPDRSKEFFGTVKQPSVIEDGFVRMVRENNGLRLGVPKGFQMFNVDGNPIDHTSMVETLTSPATATEPAVEGKKHPFVGIPVLCPQFVWKGLGTATGVKLVMRRVMKTEDAPVAKCDIPVPPELMETIRARQEKRKREAAVEDEGPPEEGKLRRTMSVLHSDRNPFDAGEGAPMQGATTTDPSSPGWST